MDTKKIGENQAKSIIKSWLRSTDSQQIADPYNSGKFWNSDIKIKEVKTEEEFMCMLSNLKDVLVIGIDSESMLTDKTACLLSIATDKEAYLVQLHNLNKKIKLGTLMSLFNGKTAFGFGKDERDAVAPMPKIFKNEASQFINVQNLNYLIKYVIRLASILIISNC